MKPWKHINRKRLTGLLVSWAIYAGLIYWLSYQEYHICLFGIILLSSLTTLLSLFLAWKPVRTLTVTLVAGIMLWGTPDQSRSQDGNDPLITECVVTLVVIGVGIVLIVGLVRVCKRCLPPAQPPPQPPCCIPNTNAPPHTNSTSHYIIPPKLMDDAFSYYDVSSITLSNTDTSGNAYRVWFHGNVESSTNLNQWKNEFTIDGWASPLEVVTVYAVDGIPIATNRASLGSANNIVEVPAINANEPAKFFRVVP